MKNFIPIAMLMTGMLAQGADATQTNYVIKIPAIDVGFYDVYGQHDFGEQSARAGRTDYDAARTPLRSFFAFRLPNLPGVITSVALMAEYYSMDYSPVLTGDSAETLQFREIATPVESLRYGGFGLANIYQDLADGPIFGAMTFTNGHFDPSTTIPLNAGALAALTAALGKDFAIGAEMTTLDPGSSAEYVDVTRFGPYGVSLRLELAAPAEPQFLSPPTLQLISSNYAIATISAFGVEPLHYDWRLDGVPLGPDYNTSEVNLGSFFANEAHELLVIVSNSFGVVTSELTQFTVPAASIYLRTNYAVRAGSALRIDASVFSHTDPPFAFLQWWKDGVVLTNQIDNATTNDTGNYFLVVSNAAGSVTSSVVRVDVFETPPVVWEQPRNTSTPVGGFAYMGARLKGGPPPALQWFHDGAPVDHATNDYFFFLNARLGDGGAYYLVASNASGIATSAVATLTVYLDPPIFTIQPTNVIAYPGQSVFLSVSVSGDPYPSLQWYFNGTALPGAQSWQLWRFNVTSSDSGAYFCVASNASGVTTSETATITVLAVPPVLAGPPDVGVPAGNSLVWDVDLANPPAILSLVFEGTNVVISNLTGTTTRVPFTLQNLQTNQSGHYFVIATNQFGVSTSRVATLTVTTAPPVFFRSPSPQTMLEGGAAYFDFVVEGAPKPRLFLYHDGVATGLSGDSTTLHQQQVPTNFVSTAFVLNDVTPGDTGDYFIVASNYVGMATSQVAHLAVQRAGPLDRWTQRNPLPQGNDLFAIAFGQHKFVAVGRNGAIITSTNGTNWNVRSLRTTSELNDITFADGRFVVVGEHGTILLSTNGDEWTRTTVSAAELNAVTYGLGQFVAVGQYTSNAAVPALFVSSNAVDWTDLTGSFPAASYLTGVAFGSSGFVVVDAYQGDYRSTNLIAWTAALTNLSNTTRVRFLNSRYVAVGAAGRISTTPDGVVWSSQVAGTRRITDVAYSGNEYVAVGFRGEVHRSGDAVIWSPVTPPTSDDIEGVAYGNGLFVAVGENGLIFTSLDGETWSSQLTGSGNDLDGLAVGNGLAVAVGKNNTVLTSFDGRDWTLRPVGGAGADPGDDWHGVAFGDGKWIAVGDSTNILVSSNGIVWEVQWPGFNPYYLKSIVYANGFWVAAGIIGSIMTSPDGVNWTARTSPVTYDLNEVTYGNGVFVIVGDHGSTPNATILTSPNGFFWDDHSYLSASKNARGIAFANGTNVIVLNDGKILHGTNAVLNQWNTATTPAVQDGDNLRGVTWGNGVWIAVGNAGLIFTSENASFWRRRVSPSEENLHAVRYFYNSFIAVGNAGTILQSAPLVPELLLRRNGGNLRLTLSSPYEGVFKLQETDDFNWQDATLITNVVGTVDYTVPLPAGSGHKFFRVVAP